MPLTIFLGVLTLAPALFAVAIAALGFARRALPGVVLGLAVVGALIPAICLILLAPDLNSGLPIPVGLFGGIAGSTAGFSAGYRLDPFGLYAALGLAFLAAPLVLWMAYRPGSAGALPAKAAAPAAADGADSDASQDGTASDADPALTAALGHPRRQMLAAPIWGGVALALAAETAGLTLLLSDNLLWLGLSWLVLSALIWAIGEMGSEFSTLDRVGLAIMLIAPLLWAATMMLAAFPAKTVSLSDLMGRGVFAPWQVIVLAVVLAFAGGAYPFTVWLRRRASLVTPAGLGALVLIAAPVALFVGARSYMAAQDTAGLWPQIGHATPPITAGLAFAILGALTVAINGLLALRVRDARSAIALLAAAQVGWGLLALGVGGPLGISSVVILLATALFGLGAMLASVYASGVVTADEEPDANGPRPVGTPLRPLSLAAWCIGAVSLVGAPLFAGFISRQIVSAAALRTGGLTIPLVGLTWAGDALLGLALLRMAAPAFTAVRVTSDAETLTAVAAPDADAEAETEVEDATSGEPLVAAGAARATRVDEDEDEDDSGLEVEEFDIEDDEAPVTMGTGRSVGLSQTLGELPAAVFAVLAIVVGVAPQLLFNLGGVLAASTLQQAGALDLLLTTKTLGYEAGPSQWLPVLAWLGALAFVVLLVVLLPGGSRVVKPVQYTASGVAGEDAASAEADSLAEPEDAWSDLKPAFASAWMQPGAAWLLSGLDDETTNAETTETADADGSEDEMDEIEAIGEVDEVEPAEEEEAKQAGQAAEVTEPPETPHSPEVPEMPEAGETEETGEAVEATDATEAPAAGAAAEVIAAAPAEAEPEVAEPAAEGPLAEQLQAEDSQVAEPAAEELAAEAPESEAAVPVRPSRRERRRPPQRGQGGNA